MFVTYSSIDTFRTCHRKYFYKYDQCIKPKKQAWPLLDGTAVHKGLEWLYANRVWIDLPEGKKPIGWPCVASFWPFLEGIYEGRSNESDEKEVESHKAYVKGMLTGYTLIYKADEFDSFIPEVQGEVYIKNSYLRDNGFTLGFKMDGILRKGSVSRILETKTTSSRGVVRFLNNLRLDDQSHTYLYGARSKGYPVVDILYNVICKVGFKQNQFESDEKFLKRIYQAYIDDSQRDPEKRKYYFRESIVRSPVELAEWEEDVKQVTSDMEGYMKYKCPKRCGDYSGCEMLPLCEGADVIDELFVKKAGPHEELLVA